LDELKKKVPEETKTSAPRVEEQGRIKSRTGVPDLQRSKLPESGGPAGEQEIRARWSEFVETFKEKRISLGLTLEAAKILDVKGSVVTLGCEDDFAVSSIKRYRRELQETYRNLLKGSVQLEPELLRVSTNAGEKDNQGEEAQDQKLDDHPVVKALIRELGAEPL